MTSGIATGQNVQRFSKHNENGRKKARKPRSKNFSGVENRFLVSFVTWCDVLSGDFAALSGLGEKAHGEKWDELVAWISA